MLSASLLWAVVALPAGASSLQPPPRQPGADLAPAATDRIIVRFQDGAPPERRNGLLRQERLAHLRQLGLAGADLVSLAGRPMEAVLQALRRHPDVAYAEPDFLLLPDVDYDDEPMFPQLWGLHNTGQTVNSQAGAADVDVNALQASATSMGNPNLAVAVIDDGVDFTHPDLAERAWANPGELPNGVDDDANGFVDDINGWDFFHDDNTVHDVGDGDWHGTHVAGTIAASLNGIGVVGVAPNVRIMALKFLGPEFGYTSDAIDAINYAAAEGVRISNNSWGGGGASQALEAAIEASGMLFVASAGNGGPDHVGDNNDTSADRSYPASYDSPNILSVAAIASNGQMASFSNFGPISVDISAPGTSILSSVPATTTQAAGWAYANGTSMAAPHATGVAALAASVSPSLLTNPQALRQFVMERAKPAPNTAGRTVTGGMVNAQAVVDVIAPVGSVNINSSATYATSTNISVAIPATDPGAGSGLAQVRLSNNGSAWATYGYASPRSWSLSNATYGGSTANGTRRVYAQWRDGAGNWSAVASDTIVLDTLAPTVSAPIQSFISNSTLGTWPVPIRIAWSGSDATSGISRYELQQSKNGGAWTAATLPSPTATSVTLSLTPSATYRFQVRAIDRAGNVGPWVAAPSFQLSAWHENSTSITYAGNWVRTADSSAYGGYLTSSSTAGAAARFSFTGSGVAWIAPRGPSMGHAKVYVDGVYLATVNLNSSSTSVRQVVIWKGWSTPGNHSIEVRVYGTQGHPKVSIDGFLVIN